MANEVNQIVSFVFDTEADLAASSGYKQDDLYKVALVRKSKTLKVLIDWQASEWLAIGSSSGGDVVAFPYNAAGVQFAIDTIVATGKPGRVLLAVEDYDFLTGGVVPADNVSMKGIPYLRKAAGDIPDSDMQVSKGTRFINGAGITSILFNAVDQPALPAAGTLGATGLYKCNFEGLTSIGGKGLMKIGAQNTLGAQECYFNDCYYFDATGWGIELHNFMQCTFGNLRGRNTIKGGGIRYGCTLGSRVGSPGSAVLIPGNSTWQGTSFIFTSHVSGRGYEWFGRTTTDSNQLNELHAEGAKFQFNRFIGSATPPTITLQVTANNPDIEVPNQAEYDLLIETGAMSLISSAPSAMGTTDTYFIVSKNDTNKTIRLQTSNLPNSFVTPTSGGPFVAHYGGPPGLCINFDTLSLMTSSHIGNYDIEIQGNICSVYGRRIRSTVFSIAEMYNTFHRGALVIRDSVVRIKAKLTDAIGYCNFDGNTHLNLENETATTRNVTSGFTLAKGNHGLEYIMNNVADQIIIIPQGLNQRFYADFEQKSTADGKIIFQAAANVSIVSTQFKTSGRGSRVRLRAVYGQSDQYEVVGMTGV